MQYSFLLRATIIFFYAILYINAKNTGSEKINLVGTTFNIIQNGASPFHFLWLHGDEKTAELAIIAHLKKFPGKAFLIENDGREIPYYETMIDPNRVFSRNGALHTLKKFKPKWKDHNLMTALDHLDKEKNLFLSKILPDTSGVLITVHNNFRGYNVHQEIQKSDRVSINKNENPRDFILCTDLNDFLKLSEGEFNVVLQSRIPKLDDGSLSWEALRRNIRYINVETRLGYLTKQKNILKFVQETLD